MESGSGRADVVRRDDGRRGGDRGRRVSLVYRRGLASGRSCEDGGRGAAPAFRVPDDLHATEAQEGRKRRKRPEAQ